jgi:hypothetical protein
MGTTTTEQPAAPAAGTPAPAPAATGAAAPVTAPAQAQPASPPEQQAAAPEPADAPSPSLAAEPTKPEAAPTVKLHTETPSLLEGAGKPPEGEAAAPAVPQQPAPRAPIEYADFSLPEGFSAQPEKLAAFKEIASGHGLDQGAAQKLVDMHTAQLRDYAENVLAEQHRTFAETRAQWRAEILKDEQLGGASHQTTMAAVARMRDLLVPEERREAFNQMLRITGVGDHPEFLRLLHNSARFMDEPTRPVQGAPPPTNGRPVGRAGFRSIVYDHPRSQPGNAG